MTVPFLGAFAFEGFFDLGFRTRVPGYGLLRSEDGTKTELKSRNIISVLALRVETLSGGMSIWSTQDLPLSK